jgi:hypothetical protein
MATKKNADGTTKRAKTPRQGERFTVWRNISTSTAANAADLPELEPTRLKLAGVIVEVDKILVDQDAFQASKQLSTQRLKTLIDKGNKLTIVLKAMVKQHYGTGSDKLVEFGIQPFRTRPKPVVVPPPVPTPPIVPAPLEAGTPVPAPTTPPASK